MYAVIYSCIICRKSLKRLKGFIRGPDSPTISGRVMVVVVVCVVLWFPKG